MSVEDRSFLVSYIVPPFNFLSLSLILSDKPEVKIVVEFPQGLTREGENLELTCQAKGKPQYDTHTYAQTHTF